MLCSVAVDINIRICFLCIGRKTDFWWRQKLLLTAEHPALTSVRHDGTKVFRCHIVVENVRNRSRRTAAGSCYIVMGKYEVAGELAYWRRSCPACADIRIAPVWFKSFIWPVCNIKHWISRALGILFAINPHINAGIVIRRFIFVRWSQQQSIVCKVWIFIPTFYNGCNIPLSILSSWILFACFQNFKVGNGGFVGRFRIPRYCCNVPTFCNGMHLYRRIGSSVWIRIHKHLLW